MSIPSPDRLRTSFEHIATKFGLDHDEEACVVMRGVLVVLDSHLAGAGEDEFIAYLRMLIEQYPGAQSLGGTYLSVLLNEKIAMLLERKPTPPPAVDNDETLRLWHKYSLPHQGLSIGWTQFRHLLEEVRKHAAASPQPASQARDDLIPKLREWAIVRNYMGDDDELAKLLLRAISALSATPAQGPITATEIGAPYLAALHMQEYEEQREKLRAAMRAAVDYIDETLCSCCYEQDRHDELEAAAETLRAAAPPTQDAAGGEKP